MEKIIEYAPIIVAALVFMLQQRLVVTPEQLERKHRIILQEVDCHYAKQDAVSELREQITDINDKLTKLYEAVLRVLGER